MASATSSMSPLNDRSSTSRARASGRHRAPHVHPRRARAERGTRSPARLPGARSRACARRCRARERLEPGRVAHRHVIFLARARRDRVDARRMREHLVLGDERRGDVLRDHEAGVEPALPRRGTAGGPRRASGSTSRSTRRSEMLASSAAAIASASSANASGWPWKLPAERDRRRRRARAGCRSPRSARQRRVAAT